MKEKMIKQSINDAKSNKNNLSEVKKFEAIRPVYTYYFPEIRKMVSEMTSNYPHAVYLQSINPGLDNFERPVIDKLYEFYKNDIKGLHSFNYRYPTAGSSEGIFHILVHIKTNYPGIPIYVLSGEYEGYKESAAGINLDIKEVSEDAMFEVPLGIWFISNPSARNGNIIKNEKIKKLMDFGHKVIYDLAYLGMTPQYLFDVSHPNVMAVLLSLSKPFGVFYYRVGFTFSRQEIKTLYGNKWFKNLFSIMLAQNVFTKFTSDYFYKKYSVLRPAILESINRTFNLSLKPSDSMLIAHMKASDALKLDEPSKKLIEPFKRGDWYRFCLTQYFMNSETSVK